MVAESLFTVAAEVSTVDLTEELLLMCADDLVMDELLLMWADDLTEELPLVAWGWYVAASLE